MESREITLVVSEEMYGIIADALLNNLLNAEKIADHAGASEFAVNNAANAALFFHSFVSAFQ